MLYFSLQRILPFQRQSHDDEDEDDEDDGDDEDDEAEDENVG